MLNVKEFDYRLEIHVQVIARVLAVHDVRIEESIPVDMHIVYYFASRSQMVHVDLIH